MLNATNKKIIASSNKFVKNKHKGVEYMTKEYSIGLDIGTNSVGWSVIRPDYDLVKKKMKIHGNTDIQYKKKNLWGVRLFDEGKTAEDTRLKRISRRRYTRRKYRLNKLQTIFSPYIKEVDPNFFHRLSETFYVAEDRAYSGYPIYDNLAQEKAYHRKFPTIYHLRKSLVDSNEKQDLRLIYLALAHITKYRGHFLIEGELSSNRKSLNEIFAEFLVAYNQLAQDTQANDSEIKFEEVDSTIDIKTYLLQKSSKTAKFDQIMEQTPSEKRNGFFAQLVKLIVGNQGSFKTIFDLPEECKLEFSAETYEEDVEELIAIIGEEYRELFAKAYEVYAAAELARLTLSDDKETEALFSSSMVERFEKHKQELRLLKAYIREFSPTSYGSIFKDKKAKGYAGYIESGVSQADFYTTIKKLVSDLPENQHRSNILEAIEQENFLRKQRTFDNGIMPNQLHLREANKILVNQAQYYPFLAQEAEKIKQLISFRIPYYVGPLGNGNSRFEWIQRKDKEATNITPDNFTQTVDAITSAKAFIERMTNYDTYLPDEKVLPKNSLLYQRFAIFNELTKVSYRNHMGKIAYFSAEEKLAIFNDLFKTKRSITKKDLLNYMANVFQMDEVQLVKGLDTKFNANYKTYHDLLACGISKEFLDEEENQAVLEEVIQILTVFEDRAMIRAQLKKYEHQFSKEILKKLERRHFTGWGRFSHKLIDGIRDKEKQKTLIEFLIDDDGEHKHYNRNFMQLVNDPSLSFKEIIQDQQREREQGKLEEVVSAIPGSPGIKKGILQSLKIVEEIVAVMGKNPQSVVIEMARENQYTSKTKTRLKKIEEMLKELNSSLLKDHPATNEALKSDRLFLYYLQNGKDLYTGLDLELSRLFEYDIDHIIPQSILKDDSLDNRVLVASSANRGKSDDVPSQDIVNKNRALWLKLKEAGSMSEKKIANLTKGTLTDADKEGFIKRQLVETRQITKHVAQILDQRFNPNTDENGKIIRTVSIVTLKSALVSNFRKEFKLHKIREVNDYHHAHDAYLNAVVGNLLLTTYPSLKNEFVYGEYSTKRLKDRMKATQKKIMYASILKPFLTDETLIDPETGEVLWSTQTIKMIKKVLGYRQMNIVKKVEVQKGGFTKETIYPKSDSAKLIPVKHDLDPKKYGGYNSPTIANILLIKYQKGKKELFELVGVPIMDLKLFNQGAQLYLEHRGFKEGRVLAVLSKYSLFELPDGTKRMLASHAEYQKANQLILSNSSMKLLVHAKKATAQDEESISFIEQHKKEYAQLFDDIFDFAKKYLRAENKINTLQELYDSNQEYDALELAESSLALLKLTQVGAAVEFKFLGKKVDRKRYNTKKDKEELFAGQLIYQSITGLYETRLKVSDL